MAPFVLIFYLFFILTPIKAKPHYKIGDDTTKVLYKSESKTHNSPSIHIESKTNDCNLNGFVDSQDIETHLSNDRNRDGIPDECPVRPIRPFVSCQLDYGNGMCFATFGYRSENEYTTIIPKHPEINHVIPDIYTNLSVMIFEPGTHRKVWSVEWPCNVYKSIRWTLSITTLNEKYEIEATKLTNCPFYELGCNGLLDKTVQYDVCGVCGGDGSSCICPFIDCNGNGCDDFVDILVGITYVGLGGYYQCLVDCNNNSIPDGCDIVYPYFSQDEHPRDGIPDECPENGMGFTVPPNDCNLNGIVDSQDIATGFSKDCNANHIPDECDILDRTEQDCCPENGIPDICDRFPPFTRQASILAANLGIGIVIPFFILIILILLFLANRERRRRSRISPIQQHLPTTSPKLITQTHYDSITHRKSKLYYHSN